MSIAAWNCCRIPDLQKSIIRPCVLAAESLRNSDIIGERRTGSTADGVCVRTPVFVRHGFTGRGKSLLFRRSGLEPRREGLALNGLQPLKKAFSCCIFPRA